MTQKDNLPTVPSACSARLQQTHQVQQQAQCEMLCEQWQIQWVKVRQGFVQEINYLDTIINSNKTMVLKTGRGRKRTGDNIHFYSASA